MTKSRYKLPHMSEKDANTLAREALYWLLQQGLDVQFAISQDLPDSEVADALNVLYADSDADLQNIAALSRRSN